MNFYSIILIPNNFFVIKNLEFFVLSFWPDYPHPIHYLQCIKKNYFEILFIDDFVYSIITTTKLPAMILPWENLQEVFVMLVVVAFYFTGGFSFYAFHFCCECYGFEWAFFTHWLFLPYIPFVTQMRAGTPLSGSSSVPARTELSLPADAWTWTIDVWSTRPLIYQLRQWATKYLVKIKLLNFSCLFNY